MTKTIWTAEERAVPRLKRLFPEGIVKRGDDISSAPPELRKEFVAQGVAKSEDAANGVAEVSTKRQL